MSEQLSAAYRHGTWRLATPEETLERIRAKLHWAGITRCADVTGLDDLGIPTCCAIRPTGRVLQVSNGKGLTKPAAQASALMEALELWHAENSPADLKVASGGQMATEGLDVLDPASLPGFDANRWNDRRKIHWVEGRECVAGRSIWVPASMVYFDCFPAFFPASTNGLASGNHEVEATLHALYELVERDTIARMERNGSVHFDWRCKVVETSTIDVPGFSEMLARFHLAATDLTVLWLRSCIPVHTFWAFLINRAPYSDRSVTNVGFGTHCDPEVALWRAVTEAAQSRATFIHGSREDLGYHRGRRVHDRNTDRIISRVRSFKAEAAWSDLAPKPSAEAGVDLVQSLEFSLAALTSAGHSPIVKINLTHPKLDIPVVKLVVPSLREPKII